jgi:uncharacterized protein (DUF1501 family)
MGDTEDPLHFAAPEFALQGEVSVNRLTSRRELLTTLNAAERAFNRSRGVAALNSQQQQAFSLLSGAQTKDAFDVSRESPALRERYGATLNGISMLMARRLVEAEVPFVSVFWKGNKKLAEAKNCKSGGGWDTHGNNFKCLSDVLLPEFDQAFSALLEDLNDRGLLDQTLVLVNSEMGGGIRGGQTFGTSDRVAAYPADLPVAPEDVAKTVYHAMGIDDLTATDRTGRAFQLLDEGRILSELF